MRKQYDLIHNTDWDVLVILDACRADYFSKAYKDYFEGGYQTVISSGSPTYKWVSETFPDYYDWIYCSGSPYINSKSQIDKGIKYNAREHFFTIDDVFLWGWGTIDGIGTVLPWNVNKSVLRHIPYDKKIIAHYMQPHCPYVGEVKLDIGNFGYAIQEFDKDFDYEPSKERIDLNRLPLAYISNLTFVLQSVRMMANSLSNKKIVITADHGEVFGKGHAMEVPETLEVPWLEIK